MHGLRKLALAIVALAPLALGLSPSAGAVTITETDKAFVREMPIHHVTAIEIGKLAIAEAERKPIKTTARNVVKAQLRDVNRLRSIAYRLGVAPPAAHDSEEMKRDLEILGVTEKEAGMTVTIDGLYQSDPFDRKFIDRLIPHHQGAIRMARAERRRGKVPQLREIAAAILATQSKQVREMNKWRRSWFGRPSPSGGVPKG